jgi:cytochrome c5
MTAKLTFFMINLTLAFLPVAWANPLLNPEIKSPEIANLYTQNCSHCHSGSAPSAPRIGDTNAWSARLSGGFNQLYSSAIKGVPNSAMIAKGGHSELSDEQIKLLVGYMLTSSQVSLKTINQAIKYDSLNIPDREFILLDKNKNGLLEKTELQNQAAYLKVLTNFSQKTKGSLTPTEFSALRTSLEANRASIKVSDDEITQSVTNTLAKLQGMPPSGIRVNTKDGRVTISGVVGSNEMVSKVWQAIRWIPGISSFDNRLMTAEMLAFD